MTIQWKYENQAFGQMRVNLLLLFGPKKKSCYENTTATSIRSIQPFTRRKRNKPCNATAFSVISILKLCKWKHRKRVFFFLSILYSFLEKWFLWKHFLKFNQTYFLYYFLFSVKMKTENAQNKRALEFLYLNKFLLSDSGQERGGGASKGRREGYIGKRNAIPRSFH